MHNRKNVLVFRYWKKDVIELLREQSVLVVHSEVATFVQFYAASILNMDDILRRAIEFTSCGLYEKYSFAKSKHDTPSKRKSTGFTSPSKRFKH
jgi:hypothetical protein